MHERPKVEPVQFVENACMVAILTRWLAPTNHRGSRVVADAGDGRRVTVSYSHSLSGEACHREAAQALCTKMGWDGTMVGGGTRDGYAFVFLPRGCTVQP